MISSTISSTRTGAGTVTAALIAFLAAPLPSEDAKKEEPAAKGRKWTFDDEKPGSLAKGFKGEVGEWKVEADETAPSKPQAIAQSAKSPTTTYNLALAEGSAPADLELSVKLKAVGGEIDRGGGAVWRAKDAKNYYIARYNPLEGNFRLYKVVEGKRTQLATAEVADTGGWRELRVVMAGERIECSLDGKKLLEAKDAALPAAGRVGLWTKADAATRFDDLEVKPAKAPSK
jgi:hypothetical protein